MTNNGLAVLVGRLWVKGTIVIVHASGVCLLIHRTKRMLVGDPQTLALRHGYGAVIGGISRHARTSGLVIDRRAVRSLHVECCHGVRQTLQTSITVGRHRQTSRKVLSSVALAVVCHLLTLIIACRWGVAVLTSVGSHGGRNVVDESITVKGLGSSMESSNEAVDRKDDQKTQKRSCSGKTNQVNGQGC